MSAWALPSNVISGEKDMYSAGKASKETFSGAMASEKPFITSQIDDNSGPSIFDGNNSSTENPVTNPQGAPSLNLRATAVSVPPKPARARAVMVVRAATQNEDSDDDFHVTEHDARPDVPSSPRSIVPSQAFGTGKVTDYDSSDEEISALSAAPSPQRQDRGNVMDARHPGEFIFPVAKKTLSQGSGESLHDSNNRNHQSNATDYSRPILVGSMLQASDDDLDVSSINSDSDDDRFRPVLPRIASVSVRSIAGSSLSAAGPEQIVENGIKSISTSRDAGMQSGIVAKENDGYGPGSTEMAATIAQQRGNTRDIGAGEDAAINVGGDATKVGTGLSMTIMPATPSTPAIFSNRALRDMQDAGTQSPAVSIQSASSLITDPTINLQRSDFCKILSILSQHILSDERPLPDLDIVYGMSCAPSVVKRLLDRINREGKVPEQSAHQYGLRECGSAVVQLVRHYPGGLLPLAFVRAQLLERPDPDESRLLEQLNGDQREFWIMMIDHFCQALVLFSHQQQNGISAYNGDKESVDGEGMKKKRSKFFVLRSKSKSSTGKGNHSAPGSETASLRSGVTMRESEPLGQTALGIGSIVAAALVAESVEGSAHSLVATARNEARLHRVRLEGEMQEILAVLAEEFGILFTVPATPGYAANMQTAPQVDNASSAPTSAEGLRAFGRLRELILDPCLELPQALLGCRSLNSNVEQALVTLFAANRSIAEFIKCCVRYELLLTVEDNALLRGNTRAIKCLTLILKAVCVEYLNQILSSVVRDVSNSPAQYNLTSSYAQSSVKNMRRVERNIALAVQTILNNLIQSFQQAPPLLRFVLFELRCTSAFYFPMHEMHAMKTIFLLRLLVPAIISPLEYGIHVNANTDALASLVTISRIVQAVSNGLAPSEERQKELAPFSSQIVENQAGLTAFMEAMSVPPAASDLSLQSSIASLTEACTPVQDAALRCICDYLRSEASAVSSHLLRPARLPEPGAEDVGVLAFTTFMTETFIRHVRSLPPQDQSGPASIRIEKVCLDVTDVGS